MSTAAQMMGFTHAGRRREIVEDSQSVAVLIAKFPFLQCYEEVSLTRMHA